MRTQQIHIDGVKKMDKRIGAQYFTIRDYIQTIDEFDKSCKKIYDIGYRIIQISGTPLPAKEMREVCDKYGLSVVTTHRNFCDFEKNLDEIIDYNKTLGCSLCGIGMMPVEYFEDNKGVSDFIEKASKVAEELKKSDLYFGYHNHAFEFAKFDGVRIFDRLVNETDPNCFKFILDTYWLQVGGVSPQEYIRKLKDRAFAVHFKDSAIDLKNWTVPKIAEIGRGNLDWDEIIKACQEANVKWALVEQDICDENPFDSMKVSYDYLCGKGFE